LRAIPIEQFNLSAMENNIEELERGIQSWRMAWLVKRFWSNLP